MSSNIVDQMTKEELVHWIKANCWMRMPRASDVLLTRWRVQSEKLMAEHEAETQRFSQIDFAKRDEIAKQINASTDLDEKLALLNQLKPYQKAIADHFKNMEVIRKKEKKLDQLYNRIDAARQEEAA